MNTWLAGRVSVVAELRYPALLTQFPDITNRVSLGHIASYLGIKGLLLSRIRAQLGREL